MQTAKPKAGQRGVSWTPAAGTRRQAAACGRRDETQSKCPKAKVYQDEATSGIERDSDKTLEDRLARMEFESRRCAVIARSR